MTDLPPINRREFLRLTAPATGSLAAIPLPAAAPVSAVPDRRLERLATGANVCGWFRFPRNESAEHFSGYIPEAEAAFMARLGLKHVRLCVAPRVIMNPATGEVREDRAKYLEAAIERFHRAGLLVMVDIHNEDRAVELDPAWQDAFVRFWGLLAARLSRFDPELTILEIINEPVFDRREEEWNTLNARLAAVIRQNAPQNTIVTSGPNWGGIDGLNKLKLLPDQQCGLFLPLLRSIYLHAPRSHLGWRCRQASARRALPLQSRSGGAAFARLGGVARVPRKMVESYGNERWNKEMLAARFRQGIEWGAKNQVTLYCGEFGVYPPYSKPEHRANWFRDFGEVLAASHIGWAVWGWDEGFGLNRRIVNGQPVVDGVVAKALGLKEN